MNNLIDGSHMQDLIPSSWGRSSATFSTHFEYHSHEMNLSSSSSSYQSTHTNPKFGDLTKVEAVVPRFDGESHPAGHNRFIPPMRHILTRDVWWHDTCDMNSFSVNTLVIDNSMQDIIPSSGGRTSITYTTSHDIPSDATSTIRDTSEIFANKIRHWGAIYHLVIPHTANNCNVISPDKLY